MRTNMHAALSPKQLTIIKDILSPYPYSFLAFGSRVKQCHKPYSDLDLCYKTNIPDTTIADIMDKFEQSDLPFKVDIVAWKRCTPQFQALIINDLVPLDTLYPSHDR
ncbi:MAG: nucleotidyltransferase domain-containing protein [Gammaproteobacteria bacterium]|nr:nucleotidyltransferase domain-containing protein [Gammaproteobacteria bacterium]